MCFRNCDPCYEICLQLIDLYACLIFFILPSRKFLHSNLALFVSSTRASVAFILDSEISTELNEMGCVYKL
jgi:hypothetical protein